MSKTRRVKVLDFIDKDSPTALDDVRDLAEALMRTGRRTEPHWSDSAEVAVLG